MKDKIVRYGSRGKTKFISSKLLGFAGVVLLSALLVFPGLILISKI